MRAGARILRSRTLKRLFRQNAETSTLQACAPQIVRKIVIQRPRFDHFLQRADRTDNFRVVYGKEETSVKTSGRSVNRF
jgi:hypothetical protein